MENILIKISQNGTTYTDLQTPSSFKLDWEDLDNESYRSVVNGNLIRNRIKPRWVKLGLSYRRVTNEQLDTIARAVNTNQTFWVKCYCPAFGTSNWITFKAYVSKYSAEMLEAQIGWTLSFNIIQSEGGSFQ